MSEWFCSPPGGRTPRCPPSGFLFGTRPPLRNPLSALVCGVPTRSAIRVDATGTGVATIRADTNAHKLQSSSTCHKQFHLILIKYASINHQHYHRKRIRSPGTQSQIMEKQRRITLDPQTILDMETHHHHQRQEILSSPVQCLAGKSRSNLLATQIWAQGDSQIKCF